MYYLDFDRHMIRQRNDELLREVLGQRLEIDLRANRRSRSGRPLANDVLSLLRRANISA
jgi:hypothetical protein